MLGSFVQVCVKNGEQCQTPRKPRTIHRSRAGCQVLLSRQSRSALSQRRMFSSRVFPFREVSTHQAISPPSQLLDANFSWPFDANVSPRFSKLVFTDLFDKCLFSLGCEFLPTIIACKIHLIVEVCMKNGEQCQTPRKRQKQ